MRKDKRKENKKNSNNDLQYFIESEENLSDPVQLKLKKVKALKEEKRNLYERGFKRDLKIKNIREKYEDLDAGQKVDDVYSVAGRLAIIRKHGKVSFCDIKDFEGKIQLYINLKNVGEEKYKQFINLDIGDWIGVKGNIFKTHTSELSVNVKEFKLLSKSIRIMPEKWHGLQDIELRYRQRYLDFMVNPKVKEVFLIRAKIISSIRRFLTEEDFMEVETPMLQPIPGGAAARPFITHHNALDIDLYLRIAPELYLKRLIIGGFEKVFELNRNFRNEGISYKHNPEFTMLEFYSTFSDYNDLIRFTERLLKNVVEQSVGKLNVTYKENKINFSGSWRKITMIDSIREFAGIDVGFDMEINELVSIAKRLNIEIDENIGKGKIINEIFEAAVESKLIQPTFIKDYPVEISPLARKHPHNENLTERFELFIGGEEIANAFSELIDPQDQYKRFKKQAVSNDEEERITGKIDMDFLKALEYAMPPTGGEGIGIDRLVMILTGSESIKDVILFPLMKPLE